MFKLFDPGIYTLNKLSVDTLVNSRTKQQLCEDMGYSPEDLPEAMNEREKWRERVRDIRASGTT